MWTVVVHVPMIKPTVLVMQLSNFLTLFMKQKPLVAKPAQEAELTALILACQLFANQRGYLTAEGKPISHQTLIETLLDAIHLPKAIAVIKVKAHTTSRTTEALGNALADKVTKQAADTIPTHDLPPPLGPLTDLQIDFERMNRNIIFQVYFTR